MKKSEFDTAAAWHVDEIKHAKNWIFTLDDGACEKMAETAIAAFDPDRPYFDYSRDDFDLGTGLDIIEKAAREAYFGRGLALVKGLPRKQLNEAQFQLLQWGIGLHLGVARPQGKASQYISEVRAAGNVYRAAGGRGYNTNSGLDFHADGCDLVTLACYNAAKSGGQSMVSSSVTAWLTLQQERPDLAEVALRDFHFSRNQEEAPDEAPSYAQPLFDFEDGRLFAKWNRNRVRTAQDLDGVPQLTATQRECCDFLDEILRRPDVMFTTWLEPGDLQLMNNHVMLHSRTEFDDYEDPAKKRLLYRLWLAPSFSVRLPDTWEDYFRAVEPGKVRGGIRGHHHDETCWNFERRQAEALGMTPLY